MKTKIIVITTGGTIEKTYDESNGSLQNRETILEREVCKRLRLPHTELQVFALLNKDSLEMTDQDREQIAGQVQLFLPQNHPIVIVHGTDTMCQTAEFLALNLPSPPVPIVLTGAMRPVSLFDSDACQNICEAFMAAKLAPAGIYICFHNALYPAGQVQKNRRLSTFEWRPSTL